MTAGREVCLLIGRGGAILWADASDSATALPDSRARWEAIWRHRDELEIIAHSHPAGPEAFSAATLEIAWVCTGRERTVERLSLAPISRAAGMDEFPPRRMRPAAWSRGERRRPGRLAHSEH